MQPSGIAWRLRPPCLLADAVSQSSKTLPKLYRFLPFFTVFKKVWMNFKHPYRVPKATQGHLRPLPAT